MDFFLVTSEGKITHRNIKSITAALTSGFAQVFPNHEQLVGKIILDLLEVEVVENDGKIKKFRYFIGEGIAAVEDKGRDHVRRMDFSMYAERVYPLNSEFAKEDAITSLKYLKERYRKEKEKIEMNINLLGKLENDITYYESLVDIILKYNL